MPVNNFKAFAGDPAANVTTQAAYEALPVLIAKGFAAGTAQSNQLNKVWRQSSIMAAVLAQFIVDETGLDALDDGTTATLLTQLKTAVGIVSVPAGTIFALSGPSIPVGYLAVPLTATLVATASYPNLFAAIGYAWGGAGTSFGLPYLATGYVPVQGAVASLTHGALLAHTHLQQYNTLVGGTSTGQSGGGGLLTYVTGGTTQSTGGADNLAAGMGVQYIVKY
jgi:Flp pilus assembly pilin Flp